MYNNVLWIVFLIIIADNVLTDDLQEEKTENINSNTDLAKEPDARLLLFSTLDGSLVAIEQQTGKIRWKQKDEPAVKVPVDASQSVSPILLPDPKDGSLYLLGASESTESLKKLPFTIPQLVASAPCRSSDGILYTGKKSDTWFVLEPRTGKREPILSWDKPLDAARTCPLSNTVVYIGRTQYEVLMLDATNKHSPLGDRDQRPKRWNVTFFDYAAASMTKEMISNYESIHFTASSTGLVVTLDRSTGSVLWKQDLESPVVAAYLLTANGLLSAPFTSIAHHTLEMLAEQAQPQRMRLYPTLYVGEHNHGLYALPSLVDQNTVTISSAQSGPLLLEGPDGLQIERKIVPFSGQNIRLTPNQFDSFNKITFENIVNDENPIILLGHYSRPDFSSTHLQITGRNDPIIYVADPESDIDPENESDVKKSGSGQLKVETVSVTVQTDDSDLKSELNDDGSVKTLYRKTKVWINQQDNKGLKFTVIILVGCMLTMFFYLNARMHNIQKMSQGSLNAERFSGGMQSGPITAIPEELDSGIIRVGKITFCTNDILGRGCEGTFVYKGEFDGRPVAVKRLLPECFSLADREVALLRESDAHPHVVRYHCTENDRQFRYIALELCATTLYDYVLRKGPLNIYIDNMEVLRQATAGLAHLHSLNIVHRDIKPQNVLIWIGKNGNEIRAMISDFGLCKKLQLGHASFSRRSGLTGTDGWIAPEMYTNLERTTCSVDIFSLGCVFYFVLSGGKHPYGEPLKQQANIITNTYKLTELRGELYSCELAKFLIDSMLSTCPESRPPATAVEKHPLFWSKAKILAFLQDVSDRVEKADLIDPELIALERDGSAVVRYDWRQYIDGAVAADLRKYRNYRGESVRDLLRALRNKKHHYRELTAEAQSLLGEVPDQFTDYWLSRFPLLLLHVWLAMQCIRNEQVFKQYYHSEYEYIQSSHSALYAASQVTTSQNIPYRLNENLNDPDGEQCANNGEGIFKYNKYEREKKVFVVNKRNSPKRSPKVVKEAKAVNKKDIVDGSLCSVVETNETETETVDPNRTNEDSEVKIESPFKKKTSTVPVRDVPQDLKYNWRSTPKQDCVNKTEPTPQGDETPAGEQFRQNRYQKNKPQNRSKKSLNRKQEVQNSVWTVPPSDDTKKKI